jgi:hypothetical protein
MNKIYKAQVNQLRQSLINQIKLTFISIDGGDTSIEFQHQFHIWQQETILFTDDIMKVMYTISGLRISDGQCFLTGSDYNFKDFNDLELECVWDLYELAHILDALTAGHYKVLDTVEE